MNGEPIPVSSNPKNPATREGANPTVEYLAGLFDGYGRYSERDDVRWLGRELERLTRELAEARKGEATSDRIALHWQTQAQRLRAALRDWCCSCRCGWSAEVHDEWTASPCVHCAPIRALLSGEPTSAHETGELHCECEVVPCARCGKRGPLCSMMVEEGNEWECPACWERCEAQERAAQKASGES